MKIVLGEFKDSGDELAEFLEPRIGVKPKSSGNGLDIDDDSVRKAVKPRHVKTYIKRFLLKKDERQHYKIIVEGSELTMIYLEREEEEEKEEKKREELKSKRVEAEQEQATPAETKQAENEENATKAKESAQSQSKEEEKEEGSLKGKSAQKQTKARKKSDQQ